MELKLASQFESPFAEDLLIVPYGIETLLPVCIRLILPSFNRTLWN